MKLKLIFFAVGTGGSGKTFLCRLIGAYLRRAGIKAKLFDTDEILKRDLVRFFPDICTVVDISTREKLGDFIRSLASIEAEIIVIDIKADRESDLKALNYITPQSVQLYKQRGMHFCLLLPVVQAKLASLTSLPGWYDLFGPGASYVVVYNEKDGPVSDAGIGEMFSHFLKNTKPYHLKVQRLYPEIATELDRRTATISGCLAAFDIHWREAVKDYGPILTDPGNIAPMQDYQDAFERQFADLLHQLVAVQPQQAPVKSKNHKE